VPLVSTRNTPLMTIVLTYTTATSTAVERLFSMGRQLLEFTRNRLSPASIRANLCFGDWARKDLVDMPELVEVIRMQSKRKRAISEVTETSSAVVDEVVDH
jgi:hypothetical protein